MAVGASMMHCFAAWVFSQCAQTTPLAVQRGVVCVSSSAVTAVLVKLGGGGAGGGLAGAQLVCGGGGSGGYCRRQIRTANAQFENC